jgi:DNA polymerase III subunit gamma/tau
VRIAYVADMPTPDEAIRMLEQNGDSQPMIASSPVPRGTPASTVSSLASSSSSPMRASSPPRTGAEASARPQMMAPAPEPQFAPAPEPQFAPALRISSFQQLVALAGEKRDLMTKAALEADVRLVRIEDGRLEVALERNAQRTLINDLSRKLEQWTGRRWTVIVSNEPGQPTLRSQNEVEKNQRERAAEADPRVKEVLARFPGAKVVEVRRLAPEPPESDASGEDSAESSDSDDE